MDERSHQLGWIDAQRERMSGLVARWASINSHTANLPGLAAMSSALRESFAPLGGQHHEIELAPFEQINTAGVRVATPVGRALSIRQRPDAARRVFLGIHMDTVYPPDHPFQSVEHVDANTLRGPGVADAKGGLVVMLVALE